MTSSKEPEQSMSNQGQFIGERIDVEVIELEKPVSFTWRNQQYKIVEIEASNRRLDLRSTWYRRKHRDYFIVQVEEGRRFEIYRHRVPGKPYWVLTRELS
ncbi:MAG: DUF6504 family protein [Candidatus Hermodarchaeia archaeon]